MFAVVTWFEVVPISCRIAPSQSWGLAKLVFVLAACWLLAHSTRAAPLREVRRILILHALGFSSPASILVDQEIRAALDKAPYQIELYSESMQGILFSDPVSSGNLLRGISASIEIGGRMLSSPSHTPPLSSRPGPAKNLARILPSLFAPAAKTN
jgi:hypothetical protein